MELTRIVYSKIENKAAACECDYKLCDHEIFRLVTSDK